MGRNEERERLSILRYCTVRLVIRRICIRSVPISKLHFTSRDVAAKRDNLVLVPSRRCSFASCECSGSLQGEMRGARDGRGDGGSTGVILAGPDEMKVDVVVTTTRTCQIEHKNTQRLSLVRLLRLTSPFLSSFPPLALSFLSLSPQSLLSIALEQK